MIEDPLLNKQDYGLEVLQMNVVKIYDAICDKCGCYYSSTFNSLKDISKQKAISTMKENGWRIIKKKTLCHVCSIRYISKSHQNMNFFQAVKAMEKGVPVESLVSNITYEMKKKGLVADGELVPFSNLTTDEARGPWREVNIKKITEGANHLIN